MKRLWIVILLIPFLAQAVEYREDLIPSLLHYRFTGFIRNDFFADTRQSLQFRSNPLLVVPREPNYDPLCADSNAVNKFGITPLRSYLRLDVWGNDFATVDAHACLQVDFIGPQELQQGLLRCWYLYGELYSERNQCIVGQFRHPFRPIRVFPGSLTYNPAAIEQAPQLRWRHTFANGISTIITAFSELAFPSFGLAQPLLGGCPCHCPPASNAVNSLPLFIQNSTKPGVAGRIEYSSPMVVVGCGLLGFSLLPRLVTNLCYPNDATVPACWATAYGAVTTCDIDWKTQLLWGQNVASINPVGGYVAAQCSNETGGCRYRALQDLLIWSDCSWQRHPVVHPGFYLEFTTIVGHGPTAIDPVTQAATVYGTDGRLHSVLRCSPRIIIDWGDLKFGIEYSYIRALYGSLDATGRLINRAPIAMGRLLVVTWCLLR